MKDKWEKIWKTEEAYNLYTDTRKYWHILESCKKKNTILDVGCGDLHLLDSLDEPFEYLVGVDISKTALEKAKERIEKKDKKKIDLVCASSEYLPFVENSFDLIVMTSLLTLLHKSYRKTFEESYRVARSNIAFDVTHIDEVNTHGIDEKSKIEECEHGWFYSHADHQMFVSDEGKIKSLLGKFGLKNEIAVWYEAESYFHDIPIGKKWKSSIVAIAEKNGSS